MTITLSEMNFQELRALIHQRLQLGKDESIGYMAYQMPMASNPLMFIMMLFTKDYNVWCMLSIHNMRCYLFEMEIHIIV